MNDERKMEIKDLVEAFKSNLTYEDVLEAEAMAEGYVEGLKDGMSIGRWISCEERLPEATGFYICTVNRELFDVRTMKFEMFAEGGYRWLLMNGSEVFPSFVLAWMPLPEPYMKGVDDE